MRIALILLAFTLASCDDYQSAIDQEDHYCEMVSQGYWPAYNESINCEGK